MPKRHVSRFALIALVGLIACNDSTPPRATLPPAPLARALSLPSDGPIAVGVGETSPIEVLIFGTPATRDDVTWVSSDPAVVGVSDSGVVAGLRAGTANVTVALRGNAARTLDFTVQVVAQLPTLLGYPLPYQSVRSQPEVVRMRYQPRAAGVRPVTLDLGRPAAERGHLLEVPAAYAGWDVLTTDDYAIPRSGLDSPATQFTLTRPAQVAVVLYSPARPAWLSGWTPGPPVSLTRYGRTKAWPSYTRVYSAGLVTLGGLADTSDIDRSYLVLIGESGGQASAAPRVPAGRETPTPNTRCPAWVRQTYATTGPDGQPYLTWAPPMDPVYWCGLDGAEHGSRPPAGASAPAYGYTVARDALHSGAAMSEPDAGFKGYTFELAGGTWSITQHFGTGGARRLCQRMHTVDFQFVQGGELKLDYHLMGDFGQGVAELNASSTPIAACQGQAPGSEGVRNINVGAGGYEAWRVDLKMARALGFSSPVNVPTTFTFRTHDPVTGCVDTACTTLAPILAQSGAQHSVLFDNPIRLRPPQSGVFWTDPMGMQVVAEGTPGAVRQYAAPGLDLTLHTDGLCWTADAWGGPLTCGPGLQLPEKNVEGLLGAGN